MILEKLGYMDTIVVFTYIIVMIVIGIMAGRKVKHASDFTSAGQSLSWQLCAGSTIATCMGANMVVGKYDLILESGLSGLTASLFWWLGWLFLLFMTKRLKASGASSVPDFLEKRYNASSRKISSYSVLIMSVASCAGQFLSIGTILNALGICSRGTGVWIGAAIIVLFTIFSGLWGVAVTDTIQSVVLLISFGVIFPFAVFKVAGGIEPVIEANASSGRLSTFAGIAPITMVGWAFSYMLSTGCDPSFSQRIFAAKDNKTAIIGQLVAWAFTLVVVGFVSAFPGLAIHVIFPDLEKGSMFSSLFIVTYMPAILKGFMLASILCLMLTSGDTYLLLLASTAMDDIIKPHLKREMDDRKAMWLLRLICVLSAVVICAMALYVNSIYQLFKTGSGAYGAGVFFPMLFGCFWKKARARSVNIAMLVGTVTSFVFDMFLKVPLGLSMDGVIIGAALCLLISVIGSAVENKKTPLETLA